MKYKYLKEWDRINSFANREVKSILKFQDQYILTFFKDSTQLQISLNQGNAFIFTTKERSLPFQAEKSLNLFEHHLKRAVLKSCTISEEDRIVFLELSKVDIYNERSNYTLIIELAAGFENIILTKHQNEKLIIVEALRKFSFAENAQRQILPKMEYAQPQTSFSAIKEEITYPINSREGKIIEGADDGFDEINALFEQLYYKDILTAKQNSIKRILLKAIKRNLKKSTKKLAKQNIELNDAQNEDMWLHNAELLKANIHLFKKGMAEIEVINYYEEEFPNLVIPLKVDKNINENINFYFKKYKKSKVGKEIIATQIKKSSLEIEEYQREYDSINVEDDYLQLLELSKSNKSAKRHNDDKILFRRLRVDDNWDIFIGKSSKENDMLTCRVAKSKDWWFHTRIFQGTHVVLRNYRNKQLPDKLRILCSQLAAYYSKAKKSENVPVDYTQIRYVRKPRGSAPGYVTYTNQKTIYVNPIDYRAAMKILGIGSD